MADKPQRGDNLVTCPNCAEENIEGTDWCVNCGTSLREMDIPSGANDISGRLIDTLVREISVGPAITVTPDSTLQDAVRRMQEAQTGAVVVMDGGKLVGMFTERDLLMKLAGGAPLESVRMRDVLSPRPFYLRGETSLAHAIHQMAVGEFRHLPVLVDDEVTGVASLTDIFQFVYDTMVSSGREQAETGAGT